MATFNAFLDGLPDRGRTARIAAGLGLILIALGGLILLNLSLRAWGLWGDLAFAVVVTTIVLWVLIQTTRPLLRRGKFWASPRAFAAAVTALVGVPIALVSELATFISEPQERAVFLRAKNSTLTSEAIRIGDGTRDVREQVADRMYDIRCRIVHAKGSGDRANVILPFSREAESLDHDIELARFVTRKVLVAGSRPLGLDSL